MSNKIVVLMLASGEEIIGARKEVMNANIINLDKPRVVAIMRTPDGRQGLGLVPWCKSNMDATITINTNNVIAGPFSPIPEVEAAYLQETSGIQLASSLPAANIPGNGGIIQ